MPKLNITGKGAEGNRIRTFVIYALCVIIFFIFSDIMIEIALKATYDPIDTYKIEPEGIEIRINEAQATYVNGYVGGTIINRNDMIWKTYLKIDLYTKRDVCVGTKYVEIDHFMNNEIQTFRMGFQFTDVDHAVLSFVDEIPEQIPEDAFISNNLRGIFLLKTVIFLCLFG
ncbi:MAG: hypothetical protein HFJ27_02225 [Clostridia bacterium]|nr:hypothetical protein [Clostridia bacterium]